MLHGGNFLLAELPSWSYEEKEVLMRQPKKLWPQIWCITDPEPCKAIFQSLFVSQSTYRYYPILRFLPLIGHNHFGLLSCLSQLSQVSYLHQWERRYKDLFFCELGFLCFFLPLPWWQLRPMRLFRELYRKRAAPTTSSVTSWTNRGSWICNRVQG